MKWEWESESNAEMKTSYKDESLFLDALAESTGVVEGKGSAGVEIEVEMEKWISEFGSERANMFKQKVEEAMDDYIYLRERSLGQLVGK